MYNVYGSQNDLVERVTRVFILRMRSLGQNDPLRRKTVFTVASIVAHLNCLFAKEDSGEQGTISRNARTVNLRQTMLHFQKTTVK